MKVKYQLFYKRGNWSPKQEEGAWQKSLPVNMELDLTVHSCHCASGFFRLWNPDEDLWLTLCDQHARLPCPSPSLRACSNSCPLSQWCHPTISSSVAPFSCLQSFPASGSFVMSQLFASGGQRIGVLASGLVLPMNIQDWFPLGDRCEFEWTPGGGDGQGGLVCCDSWGCKESDMTALSS